MQRSGPIGLFVGSVLDLAINEATGSHVALSGLITAAVGIANLFAWFLKSRKAIGNSRGADRDG